MQQVVITHKNGQALVSAITLGIEAEKIVSTNNSLVSLATAAVTTTTTTGA